MFFFSKFKINEIINQVLNQLKLTNYLFEGGSGSFLVRPSDNSPGNYSLFFFVNNTVQRFRIERIGDTYVMGSRCFNSLEAVINLYKNEQIVAGYKLGDPVTRFDTGKILFYFFKIHLKLV